MKKSGHSKSIFIILLFLSILLLNSACNKFSETIYVETAGINGGFEIEQGGLPVNWLVYTPNTVQEGRFKITMDSLNSKEGRQSLKFQVEECSSVGGWQSPGFSQQYIASAGETYTVRFWVKNMDSKFRVIIGGVSPFEGEYETIIETEETFADWKKLEYVYTMPAEMEILRIELNILKPGSFWIDGIEIDGVSEIAYH